MASGADIEELRNKQWAEAWSHSRHLETMRSQYLGFFFTVTLAILAVAGNTLVDKGMDSDGAVGLAAVLLLGVASLSAFLLFALTRLGTVLGHYQRVAYEIMAELSGPSAPTWASPVPATPGPDYARKLRTTHGSAVFVPAAALLAIPVLQVSLVCLAVGHGGVRSTGGLITVTATLLGVSMSIGALRGVRP